MGKLYSLQEQEFLKNNFNDMTIVEIARIQGRRPDVVGGWARKLGLRKLKMNSWTKEECEVLKKYFPTYGVNKCLEYLPGRTYEQAHWKAQRLGLKCDVTTQRINLGIKKHNLPKNMSYSSQGYIVVNINGSLRTQQDLLAEEVLKRSLYRNEVVHHINEIKDDNRLENLCVLTRSDHVKVHNGDTSIELVPLSLLLVDSPTLMET